MSAMDMSAMMAAMQAAAAGEGGGGGGGGTPDPTALLRSMGVEGGDMSGMMAQAQNLWKYMDELSASDPDGYKKFLAKQARNAGVKDTEAVEALAEGKPPPAKASKVATFLVTTTQGASEPACVLLYRSPSPDVKMKMRKGSPEVRAVPGVGDDLQRVVYDVEVSARVVDKAIAEPDYRKTVVEAAFRHVEDSHAGVQLSRAGRKLFTHNEEAAAPQRRADALAAAAAGTASASGLGQGALQALAGLGERKPEAAGSAGPSRGTDPLEPTKPKIQVLAEEGPKELSHTVEVVKDDAGVPVQVVVSVDIPGIASTAEAELEVSAEEVAVSAPSGALTLKLPHTVECETALVKARFNKNTGKLVVKMVAAR